MSEHRHRTKGKQVIPPERVVDPPLEALSSLRQPLTSGERRVLDWFLEILPPRWEIYIQPHLNGLRPDFVLLHPKCGIAVYEVKDWSLRAMDYFVKTGSAPPKLMGRKGGREFSLSAKDPVAKIDLYKEEIYGLYVPSLPNKSGFGAIVAGIIFTDATTEEASQLLHPLREHRKRTDYERYYPIIGADLIGDLGKNTLRHVLPSAIKLDDRMSERAAAELRHWLVEPSLSSEQRIPLNKIMTPRQKALCLNQEGTKFRRLRGPAGSGKSLVLAGRAAELASQGKRVLIVTFNITLINYLMDLAVQYAQSGKVRREVTALNFHLWCRRIASVTGHEDEYDDLWDSQNPPPPQQILEIDLPKAAKAWASTLDDEERWDAILLDEGQDFLPLWWDALRAALPRDGSGEVLIAADRQQNVYGVPPWTEAAMNGAGFRGRWAELDHSFRLSPALSRLATQFVEEFLPDSEEHRPTSPASEFEFKTVLRWQQIDQSRSASEACVEALLDILAQTNEDPVAVADLVCVVDNDDVGSEVVKKLRDMRFKVTDTFGTSSDRRQRQEESRRKKQSFHKGDGRIKVTTIQSYKGWESKALVVCITNASGPESLSLAYTAITRLKRDDRGCYLTVVCSAPELIAYGTSWPAESFPASEIQPQS